MASGTTPRGRQASLREIRANMGGAWFQAASYGDGRPRGPQGRLLEWDCADPEGSQLLVVVDSVDPAVRARWIAELSEAFRSSTGKTEERLRDALTHARPYLNSAVMLALNHRLQGHLAWIGRPAVFRARRDELEDLIEAPATAGIRLREVSARTGDRVLLISRPVPDRPHDVTRALALPTPILALERLLRVVYPFAQVNGMVLQAAILGRSLASTPASRAPRRRVLAPALKAIGQTAALAAVAFVGGAATWILFAFASQYAGSFRFEQRAGTAPAPITASAMEPFAPTAPTEAVAAEPPPASPVETRVAEAPQPEPVAPPPAPSNPLGSDRESPPVASASIGASASSVPSPAPGPSAEAKATPPPAPRSEPLPDRGPESAAERVQPAPPASPPKENRKPAPAAEPSRVETRITAASPAPAPPAPSKSAPKPAPPTARVTPQPRPMPERAPVLTHGDAVALGTPTPESVVRVERRELVPEVVEPPEPVRASAAATLLPGTPLDRLRAGAFLEQWSLAIATTDHELYETLGFDETRGLFNRRYRGRRNQELDFKDLDVKRAADGELHLQVRSLYRYRDGAGGSHHIERMERLVLRETPDGVLRYVGSW